MLAQPEPPPHPQILAGGKQGEGLEQRPWAWGDCSLQNPQRREVLSLQYWSIHIQWIFPSPPLCWGF